MTYKEKAEQFIQKDNWRYGIYPRSRGDAIEEFAEWLDKDEKKFVRCIHSVDVCPTVKCRFLESPDSINPLRQSCIAKLNKLKLDDLARKVEEIINKLNNG